MDAHDDLNVSALFSKPTDAPAVAPAPVVEYDEVTALKRLDELMLFDQSKSSDWPRITIFVDSGGIDVAGQQDTSITVYPNGRPYVIERSTEAAVPPEVVDALYQCKTAVMVKDPNAGTGYSSRDVMRWPFRISDPESQVRYDAWKRALDIVRYAQSDTSMRVLENGKTVYTLLKRYLPSEQVVPARAMIRWVESAKERERTKAAELRAAAAA